MATKVMDLTPEEFADLINSKRGNSSKGKQELPDIAGMIPGVNLFKESTKELYSFTGKLAAGTATAADALQSITKVGEVVPVFGKLSKVLGDFGEGVFKVNDTVNGLNSAGINYRNDLGLFASQALNSRMGLEGFSKFLEKNSEQLSRLGTTAGQGAQNFGKLSEMMMASDSAMNLRIANGKEADEELNSSLMLLMSGRLKVDMASTASMEAATRAATSLAYEIDSVAKLTGKNKEQIQKDIKLQMEKEEVQIKLLRMSQDQQTAYTDLMAGLTKAPKNVQDLFSEMAVTGGNIKSAAGRATFSAMGTEGGAELRRIAVEMQSASPEERARLKKDADALIENLNERMRSDPNFSNMVTYSSTALGEAARQMIRTSSGLQGDLAKLQGAIEQKRIEGMSPEELAEYKRKTAANEQFGMNAAGKTEGGTIIGQTVNTLDAHTKTLSAAVGKTFKELGDGIGRNKDLFKDVNDQMALFRNLKPEEVANFVNQAVNSIKPSVRADPAAIKSVPGYDPATGFANPKQPASPNVSASAADLRTANTQKADIAATSQTTAAASTFSGMESLLTSVNEKLDQLNTTMGSIATNTGEQLDRTSEQSRAIRRSVSNDRLGR